MKKLIRGAGWAGVAALLGGASTAFAQPVSGPITLTDPLGGNESFASVAAAVINFLLVDIAIPLTAIMVLVGAFEMITSAGDPEKTSKGRKTLLWAAVGLVVALVATSVVTLIKGIFNVS